MATDVTPTPASSSSVVAVTADSVAAKWGQILPTSSTSSVTTTAATSQFTSTVISKTTYSNAGVVTTGYNSSQNNYYFISKVVYSTPVVVTNVTQYHTVIPTNTTVWDSLGNPSSLMKTAGQNDIVSYTAVVVADSES